MAEKAAAPAGAPAQRGGRGRGKTKEKEAWDEKMSSDEELQDAVDLELETYEKQGKEEPRATEPDWICGAVPGGPKRWMKRSKISKHPCGPNCFECKEFLAEYFPTLTPYVVAHRARLSPGFKQFVLECKRQWDAGESYEGKKQEAKSFIRHGNMMLFISNVYDLDDCKEKFRPDITWDEIREIEGSVVIESRNQIGAKETVLLSKPKIEEPLHWRQMWVYRDDSAGFCEVELREKQRVEGQGWEIYRKMERDHESKNMIGKKTMEELASILTDKDDPMLGVDDAQVLPGEKSSSEPDSAESAESQEVSDSDSDSGPKKFGFKQGVADWKAEDKKIAKKLRKKEARKRQKERAKQKKKAGKAKEKAKEEKEKEQEEDEENPKDKKKKRALQAYKKFTDGRLNTLKIFKDGPATQTLVSDATKAAENLHALGYSKKAQALEDEIAPAAAAVSILNIETVKLKEGGSWDSMFEEIEESGVTVPSKIMFKVAKHNIQNFSKTRDYVKLVKASAVQPEDAKHEMFKITDAKMNTIVGSGWTREQKLARAAKELDELAFGKIRDMDKGPNSETNNKDGLEDFKDFFKSLHEVEDGLLQRMLKKQLDAMHSLATMDIDNRGQVRSLLGVDTELGKALRKRTKGRELITQFWQLASDAKDEKKADKKLTDAEEKVGMLHVEDPAVAVTVKSVEALTKLMVAARSLPNTEDIATRLSTLDSKILTALRAAARQHEGFVNQTKIAAGGETVEGGVAVEGETTNKGQTDMKDMISSSRSIILVLAKILSADGTTVTDDETKAEIAALVEAAKEGSNTAGLNLKYDHLNALCKTFDFSAKSGTSLELALISVEGRQIPEATLQGVDSIQGQLKIYLDKHAEINVYEQLTTWEEKLTKRKIQENIEDAKRRKIAKEATQKSAPLFAQFQASTSAAAVKADAEKEKKEKAERDRKERKDEEARVKQLVTDIDTLLILVRVLGKCVDVIQGSYAEENEVSLEVCEDSRKNIKLYTTGFGMRQQICTETNKLTKDKVETHFTSMKALIDRGFGEKEQPQDKDEKEFYTRALTFFQNDWDVGNQQYKDFCDRKVKQAQTPVEGLVRSLAALHETWYGPDDMGLSHEDVKTKQAPTLVANSNSSKVWESYKKAVKANRTWTTAAGSYNNGSKDAVALKEYRDQMELSKVQLVWYDHDLRKFAKTWGAIARCAPGRRTVLIGDCNGTRPSQRTGTTVCPGQPSETNPHPPTFQGPGPESPDSLQHPRTEHCLVSLHRFLFPGTGHGPKGVTEHNPLQGVGKEYDIRTFRSVPAPENGLLRTVQGRSPLVFACLEASPKQGSRH